jgi:exosortase/archaeosortase family protein
MHLKKDKFIKYKLSTPLKKEIARYAISFFFAWLVSALISDFPFFKKLFIQNLGLDNALTNLSVFLTETILNLLGFTTYSIGNFLQISGTPGVIFAFGCLGFREMAFFVVFVLLQFGSWKNKLWYIPSGIILLIFVNILRAVIIALGQYRNPFQTDIIHDIISPILMYPTLLFLWLFWLTTYGKYEKPVAKG